MIKIIEEKKQELYFLLNILAEKYPYSFTTAEVLLDSKDDIRLKDALHGRFIGNITTTNALGLLLMYRSRANDPNFFVTNTGKDNGYILWEVIKK